MRAKEFLAEATALTLDKITRDDDRPQQFFDLIKAGHTFQSKVGPVQIDPKMIKNLKPMLVKTNVGNRAIKPVVKTVDGQTLPLSTLYYDDAAFKAKGSIAGKSKSGDTNLRVKPADVLGHKNLEKGQELTPELALKLGAVKGKDLGKSILNSEHLKTQGPAGQAVLQMAKQIMSGKTPTVPALEKTQLTSVTNDSFEYLGVLSLLHGVANFPNSDEFYKHVGVNINEMTLYFPGSTNAPLADSFALVNDKTKNTIFISSKAGKTGKGAPSSIRGLAIPEYMLKKPDETIEFVQVCQTLPAMYQPFKAANFIAERYPGTLGPIEKFLPFSDEFMQYITQVWDNRNHGVPETLDQIPKKFQPIFRLVEKNMSDSRFPLFYNVRNYVKDHCVGPAVTSKKAIPGFSDKMMEMLAQNFIKLSTKNVKGQFITNVQWPYRMGGYINLEPKDGADKWGGSMTWLLH